MEAKIGDKIKCGGRTVTIGKIYNQYPPSAFSNYAWMIEGTDENGHYFMWKQQFDGGTLIKEKAG